MKYKEEHGIEDSPTKKAKYAKYVEVKEGEREEGWFVPADAKERELRNLYVNDRILTETEKCLSDLQKDGGRLTRAQLKMILPEGEKSKDTSSDTPGNKCR